MILLDPSVEINLLDQGHSALLMKSFNPLKLC